MPFENATPRPWTKDHHGQLRGANGKRVTVYDLGAAMIMSSPDQEHRDNAELFLTAVNAHAELVATAQKLIAHLEARIDAAPSTAKPVFVGIAELHDAVNKALGLTDGGDQ